MLEVQSLNRPRRLAVGSWVIYDVANTIFWTGVVGVSFPLWLTKGSSGSDALLGFTLGGTMALVMVLSPMVGAISDQAGRKMPLLVATTLISVVATLLLGNWGVGPSVFFFALALCSMELGVIFYNALLTEVSTAENRGRIAGLGVGVGFLGSFIAVGVALVFSTIFDAPDKYVFTFRLVAILFLVFALPIFFLLKEDKKLLPPSTLMKKIKQAFTQLSSDVRNLHQYPGLRAFLATRFLYTLGINTVTAFGVVYASETIGLSDRKIQIILLAGISVAIPSGAVCGALVDRVGSKSVLHAGLIVWIGLLLFAVAIPWFSWTKDLWWIVGCLTGIAMAGVWTADRPYMLSLTPPQASGEFFGLHSMVGKLGRVIGPLMWAAVSATLGQQAAVVSLLAFMVAAYAMLRTLKAPAENPSPDLVK